MQIFAVIAIFLTGAEVRAAGPVETSVFSVQGVAVDITDVDAATAKNKALVDAQIKGLAKLAEQLGNQSLVDEVSKMEAKDVMPLLKSLSIEEEATSPGRYQGKLTVRFLPAKVRPLFSRYGVSVPDNQGPSILVVPVWTENGTKELWSENVWRKAWLDLKAEQSEIPIIVALGDAEDKNLLTAEDMATPNSIKLEKIRRRYDVKSLLVAYAEPGDGGGVHATMEGATAIGKVKFDKVYLDEGGTVEGSAAVAVKRFHEVFVGKYRSDRAKIVAVRAQEEAVKAKGPQGLSVVVSFESPSQWNGIRSRILSTPGVTGVEVASLDVAGATVRLKFTGEVGDVQSSLQASGMRLEQGGGGWVIQQL